MKILVTGAKGFSAKYLVSLLSSESDSQLFYADLVSTKEKKWHQCDLSDFYAAYSLIKEVKPDRIYHLAGSFSNQYDIDYKANVLSTKNILDSILKLNLKCRVLLIGSAAEYGIVSEYDNPVKEDHVLAPVSIYGLVKVYQTHLMKFYCSVYKMDIVMSRTFNLFGKGMSNKLFVGRIYEQIDEYRRGSISKIVLGNLVNKRDYIDCETAVKYYVAIMNHGMSGEIYNVGSGKSIRICDLLQIILEENNLSMEIVEKRSIDDPNKIDINEIYADTSKIMNLMEYTCSK